ncbi:hypothetical protein OG426_54855 (plasmid) [Streptomyces canus]|uniref:hypothetical protein n=1 Tax=Streptomyces canus TaxID=58343 RepID=UPI002F9128E7|nr:hypothetical protein OG426_54855 [Streptomyces canus]
MSAATFEYEPEAYDFDYNGEDQWPEYEPEAPLGKPRPRPGGKAQYPPTVPGKARPQSPNYLERQADHRTVTRTDLNKALQRIAADIDMLKSGSRATTAQLNDLSQRTGQALTNAQLSQRQQAAQFERGLSSAREMGVLGSLLGGGGSGGNSSLLLLLLLADPSSGAGGDGQGQGGGLLGGGSGGGNSSLLLALALSGALGNNAP